MNDLRTAIKGLCAISISVSILASCGTAEKKASRSSSDAIASALEASQPISVTGSVPTSGKKEAYKPLTGRMDGVEFYINKELMTAGLDSDGAGKMDFEELHSVFEQNSKVWQPTKNYTIPYVRNQQVEHWIRFFTGPIRSNFERWITRGSHYVPIMEKILKEKGVPSDLIYLSMIESGFNTHAYSRAHAAGLWQFIPSTGRMYGLDSGGSIDERRDIIKATHAAAQHLKDLYNMYGDWYLAFAAYNAGPGTVNRALRNSNSRDFWQLAASKKRLFRQETKDYVPRILAAATIMKNYKKYGFSSQLFQKPLAFESVEIPDATDLKTLAECAGISEEDMKYLNPSIVGGVTPFGKPYTVHLPLNTTSQFKKAYARLAPQRRVFFVAHKVHKRETLTSIAKKYKTTEKSILASNKLANAKQLKVGMKLQIPRQGLAKNLGPVKEVSTVAMVQPAALTSGSEVEEQEDSIDEVLGGAVDSESPEVALASDPAPEAAGLAAELPAPAAAAAASSTVRYRIESAKTYKVKRGDTLAGIAKTQKTTVANLKKWNEMGTRSSLQAGQTLKVSAERKIRVEDPVLAAPVVLAEAAPAPASAAAAPAPAEPVVAAAPVSAPEAPAADGFKDYEVVAGDSLAQVAVKNGVTVALIREWNQLSPNAVIRPGQTLKIGQSLWQPPATVAAQSASQKKAALVATSNEIPVGEAPAVYKVKSGDTLSRIASVNNIYVKDLMAMNNLKDASSIKPGLMLKLNKASLQKQPSLTASNKAMVGAQKPKSREKVIIHAVRKGETLWTLSQKYGVTVAQIKQWNKLKQTQLTPNQKLKIIS